MEGKKLITNLSKRAAQRWRTMQDVNDDMDDLFKQAAERYPLKTDGADWDKVLAGLNDADAPIAATFNTKSNRKKRALWLLLLLPLACFYLTLHHQSETKNNSSVITKSINQNKIVANNKSTVNNTKQPANALLKKNNNSAISSNHQVQNFNNKSTQIFGTGSNASLQNVSNSKHQNGNLSFINEKKKSINNTTYNSDKPIDENVIMTNKNNVDKTQPDDVLKRIENTTAKQSATDIAEDKKAIALNALSANKKDSAEAKTTQTKDEKKVIVKLKNQQQQGFYAGALASFDLSTIKFQRINKTGYGFNFLIGYRLSKHVSVESGLGWSQKNYYSIGKYFDKKKAGIPQQVEIYFTNGNCKMFEIPVTIKYDFATHKKSNLFMVAGLSSYIMKKENYGYHGNYNNMWIYDTTRNYKNSGTNLLSVASFSLGYQLHLNKATSLRIEPYVKVPLKGIGIANMPIMSTGISVGFTKSF